MTDAPTKTPSLSRNFLSFIGLIIALVALVNIGFLVFADLGAEHVNPYVGVLAYVVVPGIMVFGLALWVLGMLIERRRRRRHAPDEIQLYPDIDLNNPKTRRTFAFAAVGLTVFVLVSVVGSYKAYHYTDSDAFCGTMCHQIMHPEYTAYKASPHARVGCVNCHIGSGATWYVKSKFSGAYQVYATIAQKYPKPIPTPVENLRPAQQTCEQCHWPEKFWGAQMKVFNHFGYDEANTPRETRMLIKVGGGSAASGLAGGIHWHMNINNEITYAAIDKQRQKIPWVRIHDRKSGRVTEYFLENTEITHQQALAAPKRVMDCVDCHNRPSHIYEPPDRAVDMALLGGRIDRTLPFIKQQAVAAITKDFDTTDRAKESIAGDLHKFYKENHAESYEARKPQIDSAVTELQKIFATIRFPEMKVDWRTHPNNVGHFYSSGCFRCHDDQHVSKDGKRISKDCQICHSLVGQAAAGVVMVETPKADFQHPIDLGDLRSMNCADCHTGSSM
ncbi:MAG: NapC/NirT family cytochrome c [Thermoanaerobaculia bacterium]|nr:NapC/NirT family cytochrome c [Thermoanaerobaculia bacterium]